MAAGKKAAVGRKPIVVDTNVLIAANGTNSEWKPIASRCANRLKAVMDGNTVCTDSSGLILAEYGNKLPSQSRSGFGDMFYLWLARNRFNTEYCQEIAITAKDAGFEEFPDLSQEIAAIIDPSDRKFIAVAHAHRGKPPILQATDSKWIGWKNALAAVGITIDFVDETFLLPFYQRKMGRIE
jgi:hypothetical protein